jgi:hypothetical protein
MDREGFEKLVLKQEASLFTPHTGADERDNRSTHESLTSKNEA